MARERELFAQQRATELAKANEALRGCLDALASVPKSDEFLGQMMAAITRGNRACARNRYSLAKTSLLHPARLGDGRLEFYVEDRVRHRDGLISRGTIPFFERDFVGYRVTE